MKMVSNTPPIGVINSMLKSHPVTKWAKDRLGGENTREVIDINGREFELSYTKPRKSSVVSKYDMTSLYVRNKDGSISLKVTIFPNLGEAQVLDYTDINSNPSSEPYLPIDEALDLVDLRVTLGDFIVFADLFVD